ncbi:MAG: PD-(D/E)XK nuclease family protein, partial [Chloroflexota bacterium]|nr:PD-(D/E)XK nuclease family protein [Chloroflexota bacterium]
GGFYRVLTEGATLPQLSDAGVATLERLHSIVRDLNQQPTAWAMLTHYLCVYSTSFRTWLRDTRAGDSAAQRALRQIGLLLLVARNLAKPSLVLGTCSPPQFVGYLQDLIEAGQEHIWDDLGTDRTAVRVMTVHKSKGLEFPIVLVPYLAQGQFPRNERPPSSVPNLPRLIHGGLLDPMEEERYLCYVALTRAQDRLVLLRASRYDGGEAQRSPLLPLSPPWPQRSFDQLASDPHHQVVSRLTPVTAADLVLRDYSIRTYSRCPRQYLYDEVYGIRLEVSPYVKVHGCIRAAVQRLTERMVTDPSPTAASIDAMLDEVWRERGLDAISYAVEYRKLALAQLFDTARALSTGTVIEAVAQYVTIEFDAGQVQMRIDRVEQRSDGPVYVLVHTGQPKDEHKYQPRTILAAQAYKLRYGTQPRIELHYPQAGHTNLVKYREGTVENHIETIGAMLQQIADQHFPAQPERPHICVSCHFNLICPM